MTGSPLIALIGGHLGLSQSTKQALSSPGFGSLGTEWLPLPGATNVWALVLLRSWDGNACKGSGGCSGADFLLSRRGSDPSPRVECVDVLRLRVRCIVDEECSEASGVARVAGVGGVGVATVTGLDEALVALAGGSGSGAAGAAGLLLRQPITMAMAGQWRKCAGASGRDPL